MPKAKAQTEDFYPEELKRHYRYRMVNGECVSDPEGPIQVTIKFPLLTKEEAQRRVDDLSRTMSHILGYECKVSYRKPSE